MQTGQLDQRVIFKRTAVTTQDARGADILATPSTLRECFANVMYLQGYELQVAQTRWAEVKYKITIRRQPGIEIRFTDTATWKGKVLDILDVRGPGTRDAEWVIFAKDFEN